MQLLRYKGKKALSTLLMAVFVAFSFLAILPISTSPIVNVAGSSNAAEHSDDELMPICGTPMYNDPEYLRTMVTYVDTMRVFTSVGESMDVTPSAEAPASGTLSSEISPSPSPATYSRHIMCKSVVSWNPVNPTTTFLPTDTYVYLLMTVTVSSEIKTRWYYRHDDADAWVYYDEVATPVSPPGTYYYWVRLPIAGKTYPRAWRIMVYLDGIHHFNEYFEITNDGKQSVTCEDVVGGNPVNIKDTFTIGVDPWVYYYLKLQYVAYFNDDTGHCHDFKIVWYRPDDTVYWTIGPNGWSDYKDADPTRDAWGSVVFLGNMTLTSGTPTGQWKIETYIDKYYEEEERWYLLTTTTFNVAGAGAQVFKYFEYDQITGWTTQKTVSVNYYGQTADGHFEIYYDQADPHIDSTYLSYVVDAAVNSWSQLLPYLGPAYDQDGDGLIEVLIVELNKYNEITYGGGISGYVQYNDANGLGMIYLDNDLDIWTSWNVLKHVFSHEFTHRIQFSYDPFEEGWIMEGMAQFAGDYAWPFCEFQGYVNTFQNNPDVQLTGTTYAASYCAAYVFFEYLAEHFGTPAVRTVLERTSVDQGITAVENAVGVPFDTLFNEFTMKNYVNDYVGTASTFEGIDIHAVPIASHTVPPSSSGIDGTNLWATDYVKFVAPSSTLEISFSGNLGRAYQVQVIKVVGDFSSYYVDVIPLINNEGSIVIPNAHTYSQIALMVTRHEDPYATSRWSYNAVISALPTVTIKQLNTLLLYAPANTAYFIYADPAYMTRAEATYDVASGEIVRSLCTNIQHYGFNTTRQWLLPSGAVNSTTIHGATIAMFGSRCPNVAVKYYEEVANLTPVLFKMNGTDLWFENRAGAYLGGLPWSVIQAPNYHEDMFTVMAFTDGVNTFFFAYGIDWKGTWASGIYFKEVISKNLSNYPKTYYIFHWVDDPGQDGIPQSSEIHEEASG